MLSDEEKEAIEYIRNCLDNKYDFKNATRNKDIKYHSIALNLIEKQSKEIEEFKNRNNKLMEELDLTTVYISGVYDGEKKVEDKIKVKIEELYKEEKEQLKGTKGQDRYAIKQEYMYKRSGLQSLLEKE